MIVSFDKSSGFCFGVVNAIKLVEKELNEKSSLYCLGDIVHNKKEIQRLKEMGLIVIGFDTFKELKNTKVLIRAHGEPPLTYEIAKKNNIELIDASCQIVLKLQKDVKKAYENIKIADGQIVVFGKAKHAEVIGLNGQTENSAIIVENMDEIDKIDFERPVSLFAQTTKSLEEFKKFVDVLKEKSKSEFTYKDSVCRKVSNRVGALRKFAKENDVIIFVSGKNSSNGNYLFSVCKKENPRSYFITEENEIKKDWFENANSVGISGATSTPAWLLENVADAIRMIK